MKSRADLLGEARQEIPEMTVKQVYDHLEGGAHPVLLDVRGQDEWERGHLKGAVHISRGNLEAEAEARLPDKSREVVVYCAAGVRSLLAAQTLKALGYSRVISMEGGFDDWADAKLPTEQPPSPETDEGEVDPALLASEIEHLQALLDRKKRRLEAAKSIG